MSDGATLKINNKKSEIMFVGKLANEKNKLEYVNTSLGQIRVMNQINVLGVRFDANLTFKPQIKHLMNQLERQVILYPFDN